VVAAVAKTVVQAAQVAQAVAAKVHKHLQATQSQAQ
jgi:hypothetical protein